MPHRREDVVLDAATMLLIEQHPRMVQHFHTHILFLEDAFFSIDQQKREVVNVAHAFLMPLDTSSGHLTPEQILGAEQRLQRLLHSFEMTCQDELARLREEGIR
ncbi:hypothetical protein TraAM80_09284 [Trypanosoma rangeli]|uniref:Uncharacterized protein n=1 Tax=Trypanosoma rangeli TaxID=5698 RepID=A0A422MWE9_TRYRA|nr:uncharacterized protein TraAM80_09284 [Trypanosoma rangeli]RNE97527.1 hypothetical protein TraAM80_09284 [Trypanosoma rangeli]|eukprot:RNE97527.1 hypothetical protein TraAM80_09284 [Trypanosoma rangeli]